MREESRPFIPVSDDTAPVAHRPANPYKPGFLTKKWQSNLIKFGIWLALSLGIVLTGLGRIVSDLAYERGYPFSFLIWGGFAVLIYILYSAITFWLDWKLDNSQAYDHGIHNLPPVSVIGRWARTTFVDTFGFFFIALYILTMFYLPVLINSDLAPGDHISSNWWIASGIYSIFLIPVYFQVRKLFLTIIGFQVKRVLVSTRAASMGLALILSIINFGLLFAMWILFNSLRLLTYPGWVGFSLLLTLIWVVIFVLMMIGQLKAREVQVSVSFMLLLVIAVSWITLYLYKWLATENLVLIEPLGLKIGIPNHMLYFTLIAVLAPILIIELLGVFQTTSVSVDKVSKINQLCKRYGIIPLGFHTYELDGDNTVETRVYGFFGLYYLFIPSSLLDKPEFYASIAKALSRTKSGEGTVITLIRAALFTGVSLLCWMVFDMTHQSGIFMWFSGITGDPLLVIVLLLITGTVFGLAGTPLLNIASRYFDARATVLARKNIQDDVVLNCNRLERMSKGTEGNADAIGNLYGNDGELA